MSSLAGRSVRLFLADGTASGLTTAEIMNWTGHVLAGPRSDLPAFLKRSELNRTGVYLLTGHDPEDPDTRKIYIGESDNVRKRLAWHNKDTSKDFWERTWVITSKDTNINKAHARYLESRLISIATSAGVATIVNVAAPPLLALPEADICDMEFFIDQLQLILPVLGLDLLRQRKAPLKAASRVSELDEDSDSSPIFRLVSMKYRVEARAQEVASEFFVLKGSGVVPGWRGQKGHGYQKLRDQLTKFGKIVFPDKNRGMFDEDVPFQSPSAAASVVLGTSANGRLEWKVGDSDLSYKEWLAKRVGKSAAETLGAPDDGAATG